MLSSGKKQYFKKLVKYFARDDNWHNLDKSTGDLGYGYIHYSLIRLLKPRRVLVIGSRYGYIPAICALACKDNQKGKVDFVDANYDLNIAKDKDRHWGGVGHWRSKEALGGFKKFRLLKFIDLFIMTSREFKQQYPTRKYGYIYIDGDHSYKGVKGDFGRFYQSLENRYSCMIFHDIYTEKLGGLNYGVKRFWQELKKSKKYNLLELPGLCGLGMIQRKGKWKN